MRDELKSYKIAIECHCGVKIIVEADDLVGLLSSIQNNILGHIQSNHPDEMAKFKKKMKQNMLDMMNKLFNQGDDFFKGEEWKF
ncbi:MAG TPA: hypothetical protein ENN78_00885 [Candidatus Omnitrophica bacterium]|nr:hypothetical protein [Candidatus Omnitrophota bacterium]